MIHPEYNKKAFLLPESINSMAAYHAKIDKDGICKFTIHDCNGSVRLWNDLNTKEGIDESIEKFKKIAIAALDLADFIVKNYVIN